MLEIILYLFCLFLSDNGRPTSYTFTYSSNQNSTQRVEEEYKTVSEDENTYICICED